MSNLSSKAATCVTLPRTDESDVTECLTGVDDPTWRRLLFLRAEVGEIEQCQVAVSDELVVCSSGNWVDRVQQFLCGVRMGEVVAATQLLADRGKTRLQLAIESPEFTGSVLYAKNCRSCNGNELTGATSGDGRENRSQDGRGLRKQGRGSSTTVEL